MKRSTSSSTAVEERDPRSWRVLEEKTVYSAAPWFTVLQQRVRLPDGRIIEGYHQLRLPRTVIVLAYTPDRRILMLRNYKHGFGRVCLTFPGGILHEKESPLSGARRELREETGYTARSWEFLGSFIPHANYGCGRGHFFVARGAVPTHTPDHGDLEEMEILRLRKREVLAALQRGDIVSLSAVCLLGMAFSRELCRAVPRLRPASARRSAPRSA